MKTALRKTGLILISACVPFFLIMTAVRLLITPLYARAEYQMPFFPPDSYGFTLKDRLKWSEISINYLTNSASINYLADQKLPDGTPLYNERELSHMADVKTLVQHMITAWALLSGVLIILAAWAYRRWWKDFWAALGRGGAWTIGLIVLILLAVSVSFDWLFTMFHRIFFTGDTWLFFYSDSLIRLFPIPFWRDAFILMGLFTVAGSFLLIWIGRRINRPTGLSHRP